jgi:predicted DNA-binding transcriptional regulator AlpA
MRNNQQTTTEPAFLTIAQTCERLNIKKTLFFEQRSRGTFGVKPVRIGRKVLYPAAEIEQYIEASAAAGKLIPAREWRNQRKK